MERGGYGGGVCADKIMVGVFDTGEAASCAGVYDAVGKSGHF